MRLAEYADEIALYEKWEPGFGAEEAESFEREKSLVYGRVLDFLLGEDDLKPYAKQRSDAPDEQRKLIQALLTLRPPRPFPGDIWQALDLIFTVEARERGKQGLNTSAGDLSFKDGMACWRGDITALKADVIVNAANSALLGCFEPFHRCIDNAIHSVAGPRLRDACGKIMDLQGRLEATGLAKITRAYALPSRFVLHTVGPIVPDHTPDEQQEKLLKSCYLSCLDCCAELNEKLVRTGVKPISTVAFCCISTGVFGYPQEEAAKAAHQAVKAWLESNDAGIRVIFNVFGEKDEQIYRNILGV